MIQSGLDPFKLLARKKPLEGYSALEQEQAHKLKMGRGVIAWTHINFVIMMAAALLPPYGEISLYLRYLLFSCVACTATAWWRFNSPVKIATPIYLVLALQIWLTICSYHAHITLGRVNDFETSNYFLVMAIIFYFNGVIVSHVNPNFRERLLKIIQIGLTVSCILGFMQVLKIPPAPQIAEVYVSGADLNKGRGSRATGLAGWPEWMAFHGLTLWAIHARHLLYRTLKKREFWLACLGLGAAFLSQSRVMYISVIILTVAFVYLMIKRSPAKAPLYLSVCIGMLFALFLVFSQQMAYVTGTDLSNDETLKYRRETGWQQAFQIESERPWVGIGPDNQLVWEIRSRQPDRWAQGQFLDNGYLLLISWGGIPALALGLPVVLIGLATSFLAVRNRRLPMDRRIVYFVVMVIIGCIWNNMFLNNGFTNIWINCVLAMLAGSAMPTYKERFDELKARMNVHNRAAPMPTESAELA